MIEDTIGWLLAGAVVAICVYAGGAVLVWLAVAVAAGVAAVVKWLDEREEG